MIDDNDLGRRFSRLRNADRAQAPSFTQTYQRARRRSSAAPRGILIGAAAAIVIAAISIGHARSRSQTETAPAITTWRAPTDVFLWTPGSELLGAMPALGASVLDTMIPKPSMRGT
jgi:hypothetical protein